MIIMDKSVEKLFEIAEDISLYDDKKKYRICMFHNCKKQATYGFTISKKRLLCNNHKLSEMIDVRYQKCITCKTSKPIYEKKYYKKCKENIDRENVDTADDCPIANKEFDFKNYYVSVYIDAKNKLEKYNITKAIQ